MAVPASVSNVYWEIGQVHMTSVLHIFERIMKYFRKALKLWLRSAVRQFSHYKTSVRKKLGPLKPSQIIEEKQMALAC